MPKSSRSTKAPAPRIAQRTIRYGVVGLGHIAQNAVLPAFAHAKNSELAALVSDDPEKLQKLGKTYKVENLYSYDDYERCLHSGEIDAVYIALPNSMHAEFAIAAARGGVHILCEKPLAVTERECADIIRACDEERVRLMTAYRLHFEPATLHAVDLAQSGTLGDLKVFSSIFTTQVKDEENIRLSAKMGGGPLHDIGIYCINAARMLFRSEPRAVTAWAAAGDDERFSEVPESVSAMLRFGRGQLATFTCSFGAADVSQFTIAGSKGTITLNPAFDYSVGLKYQQTVNGKSRSKEFDTKDQFAPELVHFSNCILNQADPEPSGLEGLADVRIIRAMQASIESGETVHLDPPDWQPDYPAPSQRMTRPKVTRKKMVNVTAPGEKNKND